MKLENIRELLKNKNKEELIPTVLLGVAVLCGILILLKVTGFFVAKARAHSVVQRAIEQNKTDPENVEKQLASSAAISGELKKNNLFAPPPAKQHPVSEVSGIFGDQVLIQNKWYSVGDTIKDATIVAIGATSVTIAWDGKEKTFLPIEAKITEAKSSTRGRTAAAQKEEGEKKDVDEGEKPDVTVRVEGGGPPRFGGRGRPGEGFMAMRQRFENMSEQERQEFRERMRERFARERGGDFGGRRGPGGR
ncbi:MAG: hypothetical protein ACYSTT_20095 [Planctomycetota bacterium]|jgi:hypothetical protein